MKARFLLGTFLIVMLVAGCESTALRDLDPTGVLSGGSSQQSGEDKTSEKKPEKEPKADKSSAVVKRKVAFPAEEYAKLKKQGTAAVQGRLTYKAEDGSTWIGSGQTVSLAPATTYSAETADVTLSGRRIEPADSRAQAYSHYAKTNSDGYFVFKNVPAGVFYAAGSVKSPDGSKQSPVIIKQVKVSEGKTASVTLNR